jgi:hypothetical protein
MMPRMAAVLESYEFLRSVSDWMCSARAATWRVPQLRRLESISKTLSQLSADVLKLSLYLPMGLEPNQVHCCCGNLFAY